LKIVFTMPVYNEVEGIVDFCQEIFETFKMFDVEIVLVNDRSSDNSEYVISSKLIPKYNSKVTLINNQINLGHGPSTLIGMRQALLSQDLEIIITVDGDGQFRSDEILTLVNHHQELKLEITEGVRINREDPYFRKISTGVCKLLVFVVSGKIPKDGNTCLRIYTPNSLRTVIKEIPSNFLIPNLLISAFTRKFKLKFDQVEINSIPRRGANPIGSTWKQKFSFLPSKRFVKFCFRATLQWFQTSMRTKVN